jgi:uncharacterized protein YdeI (YjbR/CyaY-like superfamily)
MSDRRKKRSTVRLEARDFQATLEREHSSLQWVLVRIPLEAAKVWGTRGQIRVKGEINGFAFRTTLFPTGKGGHIMLVNKAMQKGGKTAPGMSASFRLEPDTEERTVETPPELLRELNQDRGLRKYYDTLSPSMRREIAKFVAEAKATESRARRAERMAERLMAAMEGERGELPPILQMALAQHPKARAGWDLMPKSQRRFHLLGISGSSSPESRARRVEKAVQAMLAYADKAAQRKGRSSTDQG